jgi:centractin
LASVETWGRTDDGQHPVLLTEPPLNPRSNRETAAQILFETFNVPALYSSIQAVLSLYASGRTTGIVLDSGDGVSHAVPVYNGFAITNSVRRIDVAGRDVTENLQKHLRRAGHVFHTSAEKEIVRIMKEKVSYVALDAQKEEKEFHQRAAAGPRGGGGGGGVDGADDKQRVVEYPLPDGRTVKLGPERFLAPEILFNPELIGLEYPGVHQILVDSIQRTDMDLRKALYGSIVLSGGSTLTRGFGDRLLHEVQRLAVKDMRIKIFAPPERKYTTWTGGSILAGLSTFKKVCLAYFQERLTDERRCGSTRTSGRRIRTSSIRSLREGSVGGVHISDRRQKTLGIQLRRAGEQSSRASCIEERLGDTNITATPSRRTSLPQQS